MGFTVDKAVDPAFYFVKSNAHLISSGSSLPYAPRTSNLHYEMELVVAIGKAGRNIDEADAHQHIYGYACGFDMTRRDLQYQSRDKGRPWDTGKNFEGAAVLSPPRAGSAGGLPTALPAGCRRHGLWRASPPPQPKTPPRLPRPAGRPAWRGREAVRSSDAPYQLKPTRP